ncbi:MAG: hypothetical protein ACREOQ_12145 [Gemmatimonadales bacterium]
MAGADRRTGRVLAYSRNGTVYVGSGDLVFIGSRDGAYFAVGVADGRQRWRLDTGPDAPLAWCSTPPVSRAFSESA